MKNQLLRDSDLFGMANSVEIRTPFLDRELINYVLKVKPKEKFGKHNKNLLVDATANLLPKEIFSRRKSGFVLPYEKWLMDDIDKLNLGKNIINKFKARKISWSQLWAIYILKSKFNEKFELVLKTLNGILGVPIQNVTEESERRKIRWKNEQGINAYIFNFSSNREIRLYVYKE